jgi:ATP-dependent DNA ligase
VDLPVAPPLAPMLAKPADEVPDGDGWLYEPKWDGFRCIVFRDGDEVLLASRNERPFNRYFPELIDPIRAQFPDRCVVDGEIVVPVPDGPGLDFDALQQRIHPAESRVRRLAAETPSAFIAFDLLALGDRSLLAVPLAERRALLDDALAGVESPLHLTPATTDAAIAREWFARFEGAGLDGVLAKPLAGLYTPGERTLVKVKHRRTADCVVAGYRLHKDAKGVGSFLLGLYDDEGVLHHVGVASGINAKQRALLLAEIEPLTSGVEDHPWREWADAVAHASGGRMPGAPSRWNAKKDLSWTPLRPERVCEVEFTQLEGRRFRHNAHFLHWRPDRSAHDCRYDQLEVAVPATLRDVLDAPRS